MRDYQPKKNPYILPKPLYMQVLWLVRDYDRMLSEYNNAIWDSPAPPDGQPKGDGVGNPTEREALKRAELWTKIEAIDQAKNTIPEEYQKGVWNSIVGWTPYPHDANPRTYTRYKSKFVYKVAERLKFV